MLGNKEAPEEKGIAHTQEREKACEIEHSKGEHPGGRRYMEDHVEVFEFPSGETVIIQLDGHGGGKTAVEQAAEVIMRDIEYNLPRGTDTRETLKHSIAQAHKAMVKQGRDSGACVIVSYLNSKGVHTASLGDEEAYLIKAKQPGKLVKLSHTIPIEQAETAIRSRGGAIIQGRVTAPGRSKKMLAVAESIGDADLPLLREPHITFCPWENGVNIVVTGSDGLWEYINPRELGEVVRQAKGNSQAIRNILMGTAIQRAEGKAKTRGIRDYDNISCGVAVIHK